MGERKRERERDRVLIGFLLFFVAAKAGFMISCSELFARGAQLGLDWRGKSERRVY